MNDPTVDSKQKHIGWTMKLHKPSIIFDRQQSAAFQFVPPNMHRINAADRDIRTWENHFITGLCDVGNMLPMHLF